ncbi:MAG: SDR family oxidoreductase [Streptosporangiaceae bacterium]
MPTALITGATAGIGAAFTRRFARDGLDLVLVARDLGRLDAMAEEVTARYGVKVEVLQADLADDRGIVMVEERLREGVDVLVNNAGFGNSRGAFLEVPVEDELRMLKVHCEVVLRLTYAAIPGMRERGRGAVVNVGSVAGFFSVGTYGATKAWILSFSVGVARDMQGTNVKVMALCPGFVHTEFHQRAQVDVTGIPDALWLDPDRVVDAALQDLRRGRQVSVPGGQYKAMVALGRFVPRSLTGRLSHRTGKRYQ